MLKLDRQQKNILRDTDNNTKSYTNTYMDTNTDNWTEIYLDKEKYICI